MAGAVEISNELTLAPVILTDITNTELRLHKAAFVLAFVTYFADIYSAIQASIH